MKNNNISSIEEFNSLVELLQNERGQGVIGLKEFRQEYFRGQSKDVDFYKLLPSIARGLGDEKQLKDLEAKYLEEFKDGLEKLGKENLLRKSKYNYSHFGDWELMWQAQHYELPTRLLDWSIDPKVALYFSVINENHDDFDSQFWVLQIPMSFHDHEYEHLNNSLETYSKTKLLNPYFNDENDFDNQVGELRRMRQHGKFYFQSYKKSLIPMEEQDDIKQYLTKYIIPKDKKKKFRDFLAKEKYNEKLLLPNRDTEIVNLIEEIKK